MWMITGELARDARWDHLGGIHACLSCLGMSAWMMFKLFLYIKKNQTENRIFIPTEQSVTVRLENDAL